MGRLLRWTVGLLVVVPAVAFVLGWVFIPVPSADDLAVDQVAHVDFADGTPLATVRPPGARTRVDVPLDRVPVDVRQAVLAAEDRSFDTNPGFDPIAIVRAAWNQLSGGDGGGSTITQQYIKNATGNDQHTLPRKFVEVIQAAKITREMSKDTILQNYLNTIYFGRGAYGIQAAAKAYFGTDVRDLDLSQGALLGGVIQSPSRWDPAEDPAAARARWGYVLDGMLAQHWITPAQRAAAAFPATGTPPADPGSGIPGNYLGHVYHQVIAQLPGLGISEQSVNRDGLTITTTINKRLEAQAARIAGQVLSGQPTNLRTALVAEDPRTGAIVAYYGGNNGVGLDYAQVLKQPGSSFKPFAMAAALQQNPPIGLGAEFRGTSPMKIAGQTVVNSDGDSCDECDLQEAMTKSINTVFYQLAVHLGPQVVAQAAQAAGIPAPLLSDPDAGVVLGDKEVHPGDMASAYATFADNGTFHAPRLITKVTAADGRVLYEDYGAEAGNTVFDPQVARNVTESMIDVARGSLIPLAGGRPVAAKTGTTQSHIAGQNNDAWTVGYTPSLSTAVWVGTDDNSPIKTSAGRPIYGRMTAGSIWQKFMNTALSGTAVQDFGPFTPLGQPPSDYDSDDDDGDNGYGDSDDGDDGDDGDGHHHHRHHRDDGDSDDDSGDNGNGDGGGGDNGSGDNGDGRYANGGDGNGGYGVFGNGGDANGGYGNGANSGNGNSGNGSDPATCPITGCNYTGPYTSTPTN